MAADDDYANDCATYVVGKLFGGRGNAFRHGRAESGARDQVLFSIVALAGWFELFLDLRAMDVLARQLVPQLDAAIAAVSENRPQLPSAGAE